MKLAFIGGGNMGEAILASVLKTGLCTPADIRAGDIIEERREYLAGKYGVGVTGNSRDAVKGSDIVVLAVKPQNLPELMAGLNGCLEPEQLVVSIAAGVTIDTISRGLAHERIVRVMPNTPAQVGYGMSGWTATPEVTGEQREQVSAVLGAMGEEIYFDEEKYLDMVTAVSGSGPAYVFLMAESLVEAAKSIGLSSQDAEVLVSQTILGAAHLIRHSDKSPAELRRNVSSKSGTTERALRAFESGGFAGLVGRAVKAAYDRARELGG